VSFLQGQTTNDIAALRPLEGCYAAVLTGKGRMRGDLRVCRLQDGLLLDTEGASRGPLVEYLRRFVIMEDVSFDDLSETLAGLAIVGPQAAELLGSVLGIEVPTLEEGHGLEHGDLLFMGEPTTGLAGTMAIGPQVSLLKLGRELLEVGAAPMGELGWESLRVEAGVARWGLDMDEQTFPPEAHLEPRAISYSKGCYTGQETMARLKKYGQVRRLLVGLVFDDELGPPAPGTAVLSQDHQVGTVTSAALSPGLGRSQALAMVRREAAEPDGHLSVQDSGANRSATVRSLLARREG
jgi:folate-binding protein YgfZ